MKWLYEGEVQRLAVPCWCLIVDGLHVFKAFTVRAEIHLPIIHYYESGRTRITWMVVAEGFFFWLRRMDTQWNRKETQSGHVREMINSELHYWKASLIRCSHLSGEPAQDCRLGSHCCFFHYQKFPHNTMAEKTTPLGAQMQENGCFKTPMRPPINPEGMLLIQFLFSQ